MSMGRRLGISRPPSLDALLLLRPLSDPEAEPTLNRAVEGVEVRLLEVNAGVGGLAASMSSKENGEKVGLGKATSSLGAKELRRRAISSSSSSSSSARSFFPSASCPGFSASATPRSSSSKGLSVTAFASKLQRGVGAGTIEQALLARPRTVESTLLLRNEEGEGADGDEGEGSGRAALLAKRFVGGGDSGTSDPGEKGSANIRRIVSMGQGCSCGGR